MELKFMNRPFELKAVEDDGVFSGYVSVYGNVDKGGDIVMPGAFADNLAEWTARKELPPVLWQHRSGEPLGPFLEMREDNIGLWVKGQLLIDDVPRAREARALLKAKAIKGMSIGYVTRDDSYDRVTGVRSLKKVDLYEGSIVTFPMNSLAGVNAVKSIESLESLADAEHVLREHGFSKAEALALVSRIKSFGARSDSADPDGLVQSLQALQKSLQGRSESDELGDLTGALKSLQASLH